MVLPRFKYELGRRFVGNFQSVSSRLTGFPWLIDVRGAGFLSESLEATKTGAPGMWGVGGARPK